MHSGIERQPPISLPCVPPSPENMHVRVVLDERTKPHCQYGSEFQKRFPQWAFTSDVDIWSTLAHQFELAICEFQSTDPVSGGWTGNEYVVAATQSSVVL